MNVGTSICVGQAWMHGASKQYRHRAASIAAWLGVIGGTSSAKFFSYCSAERGGAVSCRFIGLFQVNVQFSERRHSSAIAPGCLHVPSDSGYGLARSAPRWCVETSMSLLDAKRV